MTDHSDRIRQEHARSHGHLSRYHAANPHVLSDPETYRRAHDIMTSEQAKDLDAAHLIDRDAFRRAGREPHPEEIHGHHLKARSHGGYGVRSAEKLIQDVHAKLHGRPRNPDGTFR